MSSFGDIRWTAERQAQLAQYVEAGMSASEIAQAFGDVTRNAVISRCGRQGLRLAGNNRAKPHIEDRFKYNKRKPRAVAVKAVADSGAATVISHRRKAKQPEAPKRTRAELYAMLAQAVKNTAAMAD